jgi:hypothetical protein
MSQRVAGGLSANLTLPDYGRVARHPPAEAKQESSIPSDISSG